MIQKAVFLFAIFLILAPHVSDGDFWLHLRMGEVMVEDGVFPRTDVLSFTNKGREWINHEWLPQIIFYSLFKYGGFAAVSLFVAAIGTLIFALVFNIKKLNVFSYLALFLVAYNLKPFILPRPQIFAYLMLISLVLAIILYNKKRSRKVLYAMPLILFLWANIHASVILALPILFFAVMFGKDKKTLLIIGLIAVGLTLMNPFGYKIYWQALQPIRFSEAYHALSETQPIYKIFYQPTLLLIHLTMIFLFFWHIARRRLSVLGFYEIAIFVLLMVMPFIAVKYTPFAWIGVLPFFLKVLDFKLDNYRSCLYRSCLGLGLAGISLGLLFYKGDLFKDPYGEWPKELTSFIKDYNIKGNIYNPYNWSGYLAWETKNPVFINSALANLGGDVFWDSLNFEKGERIEEIIEKYDLSVVISQPWIILPYAISVKDDWSLVYWDNFGVIFLRKNIGNNKVIEKYGLNIKYFNDSVDNVLKKYKSEELSNLIIEYRKAIERQPDLLLGRFRLALILRALGDCPGAIEQLKEIAKLDDKLASVHYRLAECYQKIGDFKSAFLEQELADRYKGREKWWKGRR